jgi:hypothetical protein
MPKAISASDSQVSSGLIGSEQSLRALHIQADHHDVADQDHRAAHRVDGISVLLASSAAFPRRALAEQNQAEIGENEKQLRRKHGMNRIQLQLQRCVHRVSWDSLKGTAPRPEREIQRDTR